MLAFRALDQRRETQQEEERGRRECFPQAVGRTQDRAAEGRQGLKRLSGQGVRWGPSGGGDSGCRR